jgi:hypothetical protein
MVDVDRVFNSSVQKGDMFADEQPEIEDVLKGFEKSIPLLENGWGVYGDYRLVGNGEVTNPVTCGKRATLKGCLRVDLHDKVTLDGVNYCGKVFVRRIQMSCGKPSCPKCFKSGWAVREAGRIEHRLKIASKRFGVVEHIICSVPVKDYGMEYKNLRRKVNRMLKDIGVIGHVLIFHGFRYRKFRGWFWSPHFHALGFILGGYAKCRHCKGGDCYACGGFDGRAYKLYRKNGYIVRVMGERKTIFGTAWYQLNHSSYKVGVKRFHIATWSGCVSYRKLKVTPEMRKDVCPICQHELIKIRYFGSKRLQLSEERDSFEDLVEDGRVVFVEKVGRSAVARSNRITEDDYFRFPKSALIDKVFPKRTWGSKWSLGSRGGVDGS